MARVNLIGGSYVARSVISTSQRCINLYPEKNPQDISPTPMTHYQRPGLRQLVMGPEALPVRGIYAASNDYTSAYVVIGMKFYKLTPNPWTLTFIGNLLTDSALPVSMIDNGIELMLVDSSPNGYRYNLASGVFGQINTLVNDPDGFFTGARRVDTIDSFIIWNNLGPTDNDLFKSTLSFQILPFDDTYFAGKVNYPGPLLTLGVNRHEILLMGAKKSEIWYDVGGAQFPFAELPGASIEHGIVAPYSWATEDINAYWLGQDLEGQGIVFKQTGYKTLRISNFALEYAIGQMAKTGRIDDAIGFTYQQNGHTFYGLEFPSGGQSWYFDASVDNPELAWSQRNWTNPESGLLERDRVNCHCFVNGLNIVGDYANGVIYALDSDLYVDQVGGVESTIRCIRTFPHILMGMDSTTQQMAMADGQQMQFKNLTLDIEVGNGPPGAKVGVRASINRGKTFGRLDLMSDGEPGKYSTAPNWTILGQARDMVFEIEYEINGPCALQGAWLDAFIMGK